MQKEIINLLQGNVSLCQSIFEALIKKKSSKYDLLKRRIEKCWTVTSLDGLREIIFDKEISIQYVKD